MVFLYGPLGGPVIAALVALIDAATSSDDDRDIGTVLGHLGMPSGMGEVVTLILAVVVVLHRTASAPWFLARHYYAFRRVLPRDLLTFLQDAHENRGVLRQVGSVYQFRHLDLQRQLYRG